MTKNSQKAVPADGFRRAKYRFFEPQSPVEYESLKRSISRRGVDVPTVWDQDGNLLDGEHRERACWELGIECPTEVRAFASDGDKCEFVVTVNCKRRQPNRKQKREVIARYLRADPKIADNTLADLIGGISKNTVATVRSELEATCQIDKLTEFRGKDGKVRPRQYKRIIANNRRELLKAQVTIRQLPDSCNGKMVDLTTATRRARRNVKREMLAGEVVEPTPDEDIRLYHCRFQDLSKKAAIEPGTAAAIITDIPYGKDFLREIEELAAFGDHVFGEEGLFVAHVGQAYLNKKLALLDRHLTYRWVIASFWSGDRNIIEPVNAINTWKPIVIYSKGQPKPRSRWPDAISLPGKEKSLHAWQQSLAEAETLIGHFTKPGDLVIDPCGGSFTNALACRNLGRRFIGCDIDKQCVLQGQKRLTEMPVSRDIRSSAIRPPVFQVMHGNQHHSVLAATPKAAALHVAEQYLLHQEQGGGQYSGLIVVGKGRDALYFLAETLFEELGYRLAS